MRDGDERHPTRRFSKRAENYRLYRPDYPAALIAWLTERVPPGASTTVADIGSGTGILSRQLLDAGYRVLGVEPNPEMRGAAETALSGERRFESVAGTAEEPGLAPDSVDLITAAQAFHWFVAEKARTSFAALLKPGGRVALIWNERVEKASPLMAAYEALLRRYCDRYEQLKHRNIAAESIGAFFGTTGFEQVSFDHQQHFDYEGLAGRLNSSSYAPANGQAGYSEMMGELQRIYAEHQEGGRVQFLYRTKVYFGEISA